MSDSVDFRRKVLGVRRKEGLSVRAIAGRFDMGSATVMRWLNRIEARPAKPRGRQLDKQALLEEVRRDPQAYPYESAAGLA